MIINSNVCCFTDVYIHSLATGRYECIFSLPINTKAFIYRIKHAIDVFFQPWVDFQEHLHFTSHLFDSRLKEASDHE